MHHHWLTLLTVGLMTTGISLTSYAPIAPTAHAEMLAEVAAPVILHHNPAQPLTVFRSASCGCCGQWLEHIKAAGFTVRDEITENIAAIKRQYGVPSNLASCHTAIVAGYVIEGHVPAADIQRLLTENPKVVGIATPGMPIGSPGMEMGNQREPYTVVSFTADGKTATFADHP